MFIITKKNSRGFTLVETLVAITLGVVISVAAITLFVSGLQHIQRAKRLSYLQANATFLSNTLDYWIKQSENLELINDSTLRLVLEGGNKEIAKHGDDVIIYEQGDIGNARYLNDDKVKVSNSKDGDENNLPIFEKLDNSVQIKFTLKVENTEEEMALQTTIAKRNNYAN